MPRDDQGTAAPRGPSWALAVGAVLALVGLLAGLGPLRDNSFFTHLATGRLILDHGFPTVDPYRFTEPGAAWIPQSWFASVAYAGLEDLAGLAAVRVLAGLATAGVLMLAWRATRAAGTVGGRVVAILPFVVVALPGFSPRPLLFGLLFLQVAMVVVEDGLPAWVLGPVGWLWLNTHGSWPLGLAALVVLGAGRWLDSRSVEPERRALAWLGGGLLLGSLNPYGPRLLLFPFELLGRREVTSGIVEWQAPNFKSVGQYGFLLVLVVAVLALRRRPSWRAALPLALFTVAGLLAARNLDVAAVVLVPGIAAGLAGLELPLRTGVVSRAVFGLAVAGALVLPVVQLREDDLDLAPYPVASTDCLVEQGLGPDRARVVAPDFVGNYFELRFGAEAGVYMDDRAEVTSISLVRDLRALLEGFPRWRAALDRAEPDVVLWRVQTPLAELLKLDDGWRETCRTEGFVAFVRA